jgi:hypothetical protein
MKYVFRVCIIKKKERIRVDGKSFGVTQVREKLHEIYNSRKKARSVGKVNVLVRAVEKAVCGMRSGAK